MPSSMCRGPENDSTTKLMSFSLGLKQSRGRFGTSFTRIAALGHSALSYALLVKHGDANASVRSCASSFRGQDPRPIETLVAGRPPGAAGGPMKIAVAKEIDPSEPRVAVSPDTVKKFKALGVDVAIEPGAGIKSGLPDSEFTAAGATVSADALKDADIVINVKRPEASELANYKRGALVIAIMDPYGNDAALKAMADAGISAFAMELMPRIMRAQVMDVLSSQANLAGYRAVIEA